MFWADKIYTEIEKKFDRLIKNGTPLIIRDEKTMSGRVHVGSLRGVVIHGIMSEILNEHKIPNRYLFEINDFDPMDGLPHYLDQELYSQYMGKPLKDVPAVDAQYKNYAEEVAGEFIKVVNKLGFTPELYRLYDQYKIGKFNETIELALNNAKKIREIYKKISGSIKTDDWYPLQVVCEKCGKIGTTKVTNFDGNKVEYSCLPNLVTWAKGCDYHGSISPFNGNAKLVWKVDWAAKFKVFGVNIEGAGKDHATKGGSREVAATICKKIFDYKPPYDIPYNFFVVGGKKMSSSKGLGSTAKDISDLLPTELLRLLMIKNRPAQEIDFEPTGDSIPVLYDRHDDLAKEYFGGSKNDDSRLFQLSYPPKTIKKMEPHYFPHFSLIAFLAQMPHLNLLSETSKMKGDKLTKEDKNEVIYRQQYALNWIDKYSPEKYRITLYKDYVPEVAKKLSNEQKRALKAIVNYLTTVPELDGQNLHAKLHQIKADLNIDPRIMFEAIYLSLLGQASGPKAGWFLSVLDKEFLIKRFSEVSN